MISELSVQLNLIYILVSKLFQCVVIAEEYPSLTSLMIKCNREEKGVFKYVRDSDGSNCCYWSNYKL